MTPHELYLEASERGLRIEPVGDKLGVFPKGRCSPDFAEEIRQHKDALMAWLKGGEDYWRDRPKPDLEMPPDFFLTFPRRLD